MKQLKTGSKSNKMYTSETIRGVQWGFVTLKRFRVMFFCYYAQFFTAHYSRTRLCAACVLLCPAVTPFRRLKRANSGIFRFLSDSYPTNWKIFQKTLDFFLRLMYNSKARLIRRVVRAGRRSTIGNRVSRNNGFVGSNPMLSAMNE